jgi:hypothetical protein
MAGVLLLASSHWAVAQPLIRPQPANTTVSLGATAQFRSSATSANPPITYQWWFKDAALDMVANPSAAKNLLSLTNVTLADAGPYFVVASDTSGLAATSQVATLTVDPTFVKITQRDIVQGPTDMWIPYWVDYDRDGFLDLFVAEYGYDVPASHRLYHNNGNPNNWLCVTCVGTASPRDGTGARVRALATIRGREMWQLRLINSGGTSWGGQSFVAHFGLGDATNVDMLRIEWSSGIVQELHNIAAKQYLTVTEPARLAMPSPRELHIQCWKEMAYHIETSPDLLTWTPQATVTNLNLTGKLQWTDPAVPGPNTRFYRVVEH